MPERQPSEQKPTKKKARRKRPGVSKPVKRSASAKTRPADQGVPAQESKSPSTAKPADKKKVCQYLFILGSGVDPSAQAEMLRAEFTKNPKLDFAQAEEHSIAIGKWKAGDTESLRTSVFGFLQTWFAVREEGFDPARLLIRDYQDDSNRYAVAGYFPQQKHAAEPPPVPDITVNEGAPAAEDLEGTSLDELRDPKNKSNPVTGLLGAVNSNPKAKFISISVAVAVLVAAIVIPLTTGGDSDKSGGKQVADGGSGDPPDKKQKANDLPPPKFVPGVVRVYTKEPGFRVLVDGVPVLDEEGEPLLTPCGVKTEQGTRQITVYKEGYVDASGQVTVEEDSEIELEPLEDKAGIGSLVLAAPHFAAEVGVPIPLKNINSLRPELDPYVTPDLLSIWFVGDRLDGRGIFVATRTSQYDDFGEPQLISRSSDMPGSPSVTDDALYVIYTVPEKARLFAVTRSNPLAQFSDKQAIKHAKSLAPTWPSAQMLGDGTRVYWVEINSKETRTLVASRSDQRRDFGNMRELTFPGTHPCLTPDGLRQFTYDGKTVKRYRRASPKVSFGQGKVIAEIEIEDYKPSKKHRQYFITGDEQWMFYCNDPAGSGDLFMVRINQKPNWGIVPTGKAISPKPVVVAQVPDMPKENKPDKPEKKEPDKVVDPKNLPLPYTSHWKIFQTLISTRQYGELEGLLRIAKNNPAMKGFEEQLGWDSEELGNIQQFWKDVDSAASALKKGDKIRLGQFEADFQEYKDQEIYARRGVNPIRKKLKELSPSESMRLFDKYVASDDAAAQFRAAVFLSYDKDALQRSAENRMKKAGDLAAQFTERRIRRALVQAVAELDRGNFAQGVRFLNDVKDQAQGTAIEQEAAALEAKLYTYIKWNKRGPRNWQTTSTSYGASIGASRGSLLVSEIEYKHFEMSLEWKVDNETTAQGGVYFRYRGQGDLQDNAFKIQMANDAGISPDPYATGSLFTLAAPDENASKSPGEWNTTTIRYVDKEVTVTINGKKVLEAIVDNPDVDNIPEKGFIALDGEAGGIVYRKILISELP